MSFNYEPKYQIGDTLKTCDGLSVVVSDINQEGTGHFVYRVETETGAFGFYLEDKLSASGILKSQQPVARTNAQQAKVVSRNTEQDTGLR